MMTHPNTLWTAFRKDQRNAALVATEHASPYFFGSYAHHRKKKRRLRDARCADTMIAPELPGKKNQQKGRGHALTRFDASFTV
jgi:hypothetical protein